MKRPRFHQKDVTPDARWRYLILDGYVDEPADLGVPPYLSPQIRSLAGGLISGGASKEEIGYVTVDQWRQFRGRVGNLFKIVNPEFLIVVFGCLVPGKYLRGTPISKREVLEASVGDHKTVVAGSGAEGFTDDPLSICKGDPGVLGQSISSQGRVTSRDRTIEEWNHHLIEGSFICTLHPDHPTPLICEIETSVGCPRYITGGCSFCLEPSRGKMVFREPDDIIEEIAVLSNYGVNNIRLGGQSDLLAYGSDDIGKSEIVEPSPKEMKKLLSGVRSVLYSGKGIRNRIASGLRPGIDCGIIHTDNSNPAVISTYPSESLEVLKIIVDHITSGSVLALGLESTDPVVKEKNNLNSTPDQVMSAVEIINSVGGHRGLNGMPVLLPGINFLGDLPGQTEESFRGDLLFLRDVLKRGLLLRRINIRRARFNVNVDIPSGAKKGFWKFRNIVRNEMDPAFLRLIFPDITPLRGIYVETIFGRSAYGRQIGSYPLMVKIMNTVEKGSPKDVAVTDLSGRSVKGFTFPFHINQASFNDLQSIPGVGKSRAAKIFSELPMEEARFLELCPDSREAMEFIDFSTG